MAFEREAMDFVKFDVAMEHGQRIKRSNSFNVSTQS